MGRKGAPDLSSLALPATAGALADLPAPGLGIGAVRRASGMGWGHDIGAVLALWLPDSAEGGVGGKHVHGRPQLLASNKCVRCKRWTDDLEQRVYEPPRRSDGERTEFWGQFWGPDVLTIEE